MPDSVLANSAIKIIGRQDRKDDIEMSIVQIGKDGLSYNIFSAIDDYLEVHEIIKVSLLKTCDIDVREAALDISANTRSEIVQIIGRVIVLYRPSKERVIELPC